ncbi:MAG: lipase family protein [Pseudohongiella sp.]|nr:lipase family protein [Pseudohongiella sp.]
MSLDYLISVAQLCRDVYQRTPNTERLDILGIHHFKAGGDYGCAYVSPDTVYITIAGSDDPVDWMSNFQTLLRADWYGITAHRGFVQAAKALEDAMLAVLKQYPVHSMVFTGHSRGGAIALLLAISAEINLPMRRGSRCITFGQPRASTASQIRLAYRYGEYVRVENGADFVCRWPKLGYSHAGTCLYIRKSGGHEIDPSPLAQLRDRAFSLWSRGQDHRMTDYIQELKKCAQL